MRARVALGLVLSACGGSTGAGSTPPPEPSAPETAPAAVPASAPEATPAPTTPEAAPVDDPGRPEGLVLRGTPGRAHSVSIALENRGSALVRLSSALGVERQDGEAFVPVSTSGLTLRPDCDHEAPTCVDLAPGGALRPPEFLGTSGDAQCGCDECGPLDAGVYRFVATTCAGGHRIEGEPFDLDAR